MMLSPLLRTTLLWLALPLLILTLAFIPNLLPPPGLQTADPMGGYLNGVFPTETPSTGGGNVTYTIENAYPNLTFTDPVDMAELPGGNDFLVVGLQGHIWKIPKQGNPTSKQLLLDISTSTVVYADGGMLGIVLHPEFGQAGSPNSEYLYVFYRYTPVDGTDRTTAAVRGYMRLSRFELPAGGNSIDPNSEYVMIQVYDRHDWHNGGDMFFGPDGFLYLVVGDEGAANDSYNVTQQIDKWLFGGVLRIDVDQQGGSISHPIRRQPQNAGNPPSGWPGSFTQGYYIPNDNPWLDVNGGILEEFWAIGTRSPHRMTYDPPTGEIWIGDIGQGSKEEVSIVAKGDNLQWPYREGDQAGPKSQPNPLIGNDKPPIYAYGRSVGRSVTGGFVYRGNKYPELLGKYFFGDHETQNVWTLEKDPGGGAPTVNFLLNVPVNGSGSKDGISSFYIDSDGTIFITDLFGTGQDGGVIHRLKREGGAVPDPPTKLSDLGVFSDLQNLTPAPGLIPYTVNNPLWSDRAAKKRWIALPTDGTFDSSTEQIVFDEEENWNFPSGTVLIKHFDLPTDEGDPTQSTKLETRFFVFTSVGDAYGVTYRWNDAGTEAFLINDAETRDITITQAGGGTYTQTWEFPSRQQCMQCHNSVAGFALGLKTRQLNGDHFYPSSGLTANQLETWNHLNIFHQGIGDPSLLPQLASMEDPTASSEMKVRSYLDANCSYCHRPNGVEGAFDARSLNALFDQNMVGTLGVSHATPTGNIIVTPGQTSTSELWVRDQSTGTNKMPPVGRSLPDADYLAELTTWINNLDGNGPESLADGIYSFTARHSGLLATVENASAADNARMVQSAATGGDEQKWSIQHMGNGKYRILSVATNKALSMKDLRANRGAEVVQLPWSGAQHQLWYFEDTDNGYYQIKNAYNNLHIDVFTGQNTDGLHTVSWTPHSLNNQQWLPSLLSPGGGNPSCPNGELTYLSDLNWTSASQQWGTMRKDLNIFGAQLSINGNTYTKGIGTHALSTIVYDLAGTYETFKSDIGVDQSAGDGAPSSIQFIVNGDGAELYRSPVMTSLDDAISIEINVVGIQTLELIVDGVAAQSPSNNPIHSDHADWADARLENCGDVFDAIGESGSVTFDHNWSTVILSRSYTDPVVIVSDLSFNGGNQSTVRVRNVTANSFEVRVDEWECLDEWHVTETAAYLVVEAGEYELENGKKLIAANEANVNNSWKTLSFPSDFASEPLIFGQCVTENEAEAVNVFVDERNTNLTQMRIKLKEQDKATGGHAHEVVSWIAVETGLHTTDNLMEYVNSGRIVDEGWENLSFQQTYAATPLFIGKIGTEHGGDAAAMRYRNLTATGVQVKVEEETCGDSETGHTNEEIHFIVMAQAGDLMGKDATTPATALLAVTEARFDWLSVQAEQEASRIRLNWRVAGEKDIITYALEQSTDNQTFVITTDQPGSGSPHKVSYEAYDENPYLGMNYYRVKAIDQTGNVYYSQTLHVLYEHNQPIILVYPNPVRKEEMLTADIRISQEGPIKASLIDMQGRSLFTKERTLVGLQAFWQFPIRDIAPGMYLIRFEGEGWSQVQRILIQN